MYEIFTYGRFEVDPANEEAFVAAWSEFAARVSERPANHGIRLVRDVRNPGRFLSLGLWDDANAIAEWKSAAEFKERLRGVVSQAKEFEPTELVVLRKAADGSIETLSPPEIEAIHAPT